MRFRRLWLSKNTKETTTAPARTQSRILRSRRFASADRAAREAGPPGSVWFNPCLTDFFLMAL